MRATFATRFWAKVVQSEGCWRWTGSKTSGYGELQRGRRVEGRVRAHRASWELHFGAIPDGLLVCHKCDNPECTNPAHLFLGTHLDNVADMVAKGRGAKGDAHGSRLHPESVPRGERHGCAKLTTSQVEEIRSRPLRHGEQRQFALRFGVSEATISMVVNGMMWGATP